MNLMDKNYFIGKSNYIISFLRKCYHESDF